MACIRAMNSPKELAMNTPLITDFTQAERARGSVARDTAVIFSLLSACSLHHPHHHHSH